MLKYVSRTTCDNFKLFTCNSMKQVRIYNTEELTVNANNVPVNKQQASVL